MKKILFLATGIMSLLVACQGDPKTEVIAANIEPSRWVTEQGSIFASHGDEFTLSKDQAAELLDVISWTPTDFGYNAAVSYSIELAIKKEGQNVGAYTTVAVSNKPSYDMTVNDLNAGILNAGGVKRQLNNVLIRVVASISSVYAPQYSEPFEFKATTFSTDPDLLYFVDASGVVIDPEYIFAPKWDGAYDGFAYIPYAAGGIWLVEEINPDVKWGIASATEQGATLTLKKQSEGGVAIMPGAFGSGDVEPSFVASGYYRAQVKFTEAKNTIQLWRFYGKFFVAGQTNMNYIWWGTGFSKQNPDIAPWNVTGDLSPDKYYVWGTGALLTYNPQQRVWTSDVVYVPKFKTAEAAPPQEETTTQFDFKFRANFGSSWGNAANMGGTADPITGDGIQRGSAAVGGKNIKFNAPAGNYRWRVYLNEYPTRYELIPITE